MAEPALEEIEGRLESPPRAGAGRAVWLLTFCQFLYSMGISVDLTLTALAGLRLAPSPALATVPLTVMMTTTMIGGFGTGLLSARFGARTVLGAGALIAVVGGAVCVWAMWTGSFLTLCVGTGLVGVYKASGGYFRYLAADRALPGRQDMAISMVLCGGVVAALVGPAVATWSGHLLSAEFAGAYVLVSVLALLVVPLLTLIGPPAAPNAAGAEPVEVQPPMPLRTAVATPDFQLALLLLAVSGGVMTMLMAAAPIASMDAGHSPGQGATMIQWHMVGMFAPSLISGRLVTRWGPARTALGGLLVLVAGAAVGASGTGAAQLLVSMLLVGIGWNLLLVSGTAYAVRCYRPGAGGRVQAAVEGVSGVVIALASLTASWAFAQFGWRSTSLATAVATAAAIPLMLIVLARRGRDTNPA
jgi:MFS family permease